MATSAVNRYRTCAVLEVGRRAVLHYILTSGTNKPPSMRIDDYLRNLPSSSTANYRTMNSKEKQFSKAELRQIELDPTTCASFEITLLCKIINFACEGLELADTKPMSDLELCIKAIKDWRNECYHGPHEITLKDYQEASSKLKTLFHDTLRATERRYKLPSVNVDAQVEMVYRELQKIDNEALGKDDLLLYCAPQMKMDLINETDAQLKENLEGERNFNPVSFLLGMNAEISFHTVEIRVTEENLGKAGTIISHKDVMSTVRPKPDCTQPRVLLMYGPAGCGKTTLLSMIGEEWLKDSHARNITWLDHYSLLLRVQGRDSGVTSLEELLQNMVPEVYVKFRELLLPLLKTCNVLFLIDELHEANPDATKLTDDILLCSQGCSNWTVLFTSRPEGLSTLESRIPSHYNKTYIEVLGVAAAQRESFVQHYYHEMQLKIFGKQDTQDTKQILEKVRHIFPLEHFRLPLNILFLTWVCVKKPDVITASLTKTELYQSSYELCFERLVHRVAPRVTMPEHVLRSSLNECVSVLQKECLLALSNLQISVTGEAEDHIRTSCDARGVPVDDVLSSFFSLQESRSVNGVLEKQYLIPHKSLLEFYAARFMVRHPSISKIPRGIKTVLQETLGIAQPELPRFKNVLTYVAGLMHQPFEEMSDELSKEVVDLLMESGMENKDQWFDLLAETKAATPIVKCVVKYLPAARGAIHISDSRVWIGTVLLQHLPPSRIEINLWRDLTGQEAQLEALVSTLGNHICTVFHLNHHFRHPDPSTNSNHILHLLPVLLRSNLVHFTGHLSAAGYIELLQDCHRLDHLRLALCDDRDTPTILSSLSPAQKWFPRLLWFWVHVPVTRITPENITTPLPGLRVILTLSEVEEHLFEKTCLIASALQPRRGFDRISFPGCFMEVKKWGRLIILLSDARVWVRPDFGFCVWVDEKNAMTRDEERELDYLAKTRGLNGFERKTTPWLW